MRNGDLFQMLHHSVLIFFTAKTKMIKNYEKMEKQLKAKEHIYIYIYIYIHNIYIYLYI